MHIEIDIKQWQTPKGDDQVMLTIDGVCFFASANGPDDVGWAPGEGRPPVWARRVVKHALTGFYEGQQTIDATDQESDRR